MISTNLLNARTFASLAHLNAVVAETWLPQIDARPHDTTGHPPLALWEEERAHLVPLPAHAYDTAAVVYRVVGPESTVAERRFRGVVSSAVQDGRFVTVTTGDGTQVRLRVTATLWSRGSATGARSGRE